MATIPAEDIARAHSMPAAEFTEYIKKARPYHKVLLMMSRKVKTTPNTVYGVQVRLHNYEIKSKIMGVYMVDMTNLDKPLFTMFGNDGIAKHKFNKMEGCSTYLYKIECLYNRDGTVVQQSEEKARPSVFIDLESCGTVSFTDFYDDGKLFLTEKKQMEAMLKQQKMEEKKKKLQEEKLKKQQDELRKKQKQLEEEQAKQRQKEEQARKIYEDKIFLEEKARREKAKELEEAQLKLKASEVAKQMEQKAQENENVAAYYKTVMKIINDDKECRTFLRPTPFQTMLVYIKYQNPEFSADDIMKKMYEASPLIDFVSNSHNRSVELENLVIPSTYKREREVTPLPEQDPENDNEPSPKKQKPVREGDSMDNALNVELYPDEKVDFSDVADGTVGKVGEMD